jgi:hypothetical protein
MVYFTRVDRFKLLEEKVLRIDEQLITFNRKRLSKEIIDSVVFNILPDTRFLGEGVAKIAYLIKFGKRPFVLKIVKQKSRMKAYLYPYLLSGKTPQERNRYFVKHYFASEYCILQRFGTKMDESDSAQIAQYQLLKKKFKRKLYDIRPVNLVVDLGKVKIIDALVSGHPTKNTVYEYADFNLNLTKVNK